MCVIYVVGKKLPPIRELEVGFKQNSDGAGLAWWEKKKNHVRFVKGLDTLDQVMTVLENDVKGKLPLLMHFRAASQGEKCPELTHPFPVLPDAPLTLEGDAPAVLAQNGTWTSWKESIIGACLRAGVQIPGGLWSDTRAITFLVSLLGPKFLDFAAGLGRVALFQEGLIWKYSPSMWEKEADGYTQSSPTHMSRGHILNQVNFGGLVCDDEDDLSGWYHRDLGRGSLTEKEEKGIMVIKPSTEDKESDDTEEWLTEGELSSLVDLVLEQYNKLLKERRAA